MTYMFSVIIVTMTRIKPPKNRQELFLLLRHRMMVKVPIVAVSSMGAPGGAQEPETARVTELKVYEDGSGYFITMELNSIFIITSWTLSISMITAQQR
jgi:hypothetical protein